jgi:hypothetical protein
MQYSLFASSNGRQRNSLSVRTNNIKCYCLFLLYTPLHALAQLLDALRYKPEGCESVPDEAIPFLIDAILPDTIYGSGGRLNL